MHSNIVHFTVHFISRNHEDPSLRIRDETESDIAPPIAAEVATQAKEYNEVQDGTKERGYKHLRIGKGRATQSE